MHVLARVLPLAQPIIYDIVKLAHILLQAGSRRALKPAFILQGGQKMRATKFAGIELSTGQMLTKGSKKY
jgi:hypothetical protein